MASDATKAGKARKCIACRKSTKKVMRRGMCPACAAAAYRHVRNGVATWDDLIARGLAKPTSPAVSNPITKALSR